MYYLKFLLYSPVVRIHVTPFYGTKRYRRMGTVGTVEWGCSMSKTQSHASSLVLGNMTALHPYWKSYSGFQWPNEFILKFLLLTFKSLSDMAPFYLRELLSPYIPSRTLRSSSKSSLVIPRCNLKTYGQRAFSCITPVLWNSLPEDIRSCKSLTIFKTKLKTSLFKRIFQLTLHYIYIYILFNCKYCQLYYLIVKYRKALLDTL